MTPYSPQQIVVALLLGGGVLVLSGDWRPPVTSSPSPAWSSLVPSPPPSPPRAASVSRGRQGTIPLSSLDLNAATGSELQALPGIGPVLAARIVEYREQHGPFVSTEELVHVAGIGPGRLSRIIPFLRVGLVP